MKIAKYVFIALTAVFLCTLLILFFCRNENAGYQFDGTDSTPTNITADADVGRLNINIATAEQLDQLPGIGPVLASRIVEYRDKNGPFKFVSQLTEVDGIGEKTLNELSQYITVGG